MTENALDPKRYPVTIEQDGETFELTVTVTTLEKRHEPAPALLGGDKIGLEAQIGVTQGEGTQPTTFFLSRLVGEPVWIIDAKFGPNGFPHFSHGFGSRVTFPKGILPEIEDVLDTLARERGLATQIGRDIELELAGE